MNVGKVQAELERMRPKELRDRYGDVFGETTNTNNKAWLVKRILWRMQANAEGGLSERAIARAKELANDADLRTSAPKAKPKPATPQAPTSAATVAMADRVPVPGSVITRDYKGRTLHVTVLAAGFEFEGEVYKSLSAVAKFITGTHCNGFLFFKLNGGAK